MDKVWGDWNAVQIRVTIQGKDKGRHSKREQVYGVALNRNGLVECSVLVSKRPDREYQCLGPRTWPKRWADDAPQHPVLLSLG